MIGFIMCGHGNFASGITSALELILGEQEDYQVVDFPIGDTATELEKNLDGAVIELSSCSEIVILCDLLSGSPFNFAISKALEDERLKVIYGVNLGLLIEIVMKRNQGEPLEKLLAAGVETGKEQIGQFTKEALSVEVDPFD